MGSWSSKHDDRQPLVDDVDEEPILEKLTILLFGHHGAGKNTVGNAILCKTAFKYKHRSEGCYCKKENTIFGRNVTVIRVPGWFEDLSNKKNKEHWQVVKDSVLSIAEGPHLLLLIGKFNTEHTQIKVLRQILGDSVVQHILPLSVDGKCIVVRRKKLRTSIDRCRYHFIHCRCKNQSRELLETIENFILDKKEIRFYPTGRRAPTPESKYQDLNNLVNGLLSHIAILERNAADNQARIQNLQMLLREKEKMLRALKNEEEILISNSTDTNHLVKIIDQLTKQKKALKIENENLKRNNVLTAVRWRKEMSCVVNVYPISAGDTELQPISELGDKEEPRSKKSDSLEFLKKHRKELIDRVVSVQPIADELLPCIGDHKYSLIQQASTSQDKMREIFNIVMKGGKTLQDELFRSLQKEEKYLLEDLENE